MEFTSLCPVCGNNKYKYQEVLWPELIEDWQLKPHEVYYINKQQGLVCTKCGSNLRSMALANAVLNSWNYKGTLIQFSGTRIARELNILEINEAGNLTPIFENIPGHKLINFPAYDMTSLNLETGMYDLVVHSDTLEHIKNPLQGLVECHRVLTQTGRCIFTIPVILGRLTRSREGLKKSYHGTQNQTGSDLLVQTEFGCDAWKYVLESGFTSVTVHSVDYPAGLAFEARRS